jgi:hypothetical protein
MLIDELTLYFLREDSRSLALGIQYDIWLARSGK